MKDKIQSILIPNNWASDDITCGYANGYVGVPKGHPWFGKGYDDIECSIHGGLTYAEDVAPRMEKDGLWYVGFDTLHHGDSPQTCDEFYCRGVLEDLKNQAIKAINRELSFIDIVDQTGRTSSLAVYGKRDVRCKIHRRTEK